MLFRSRPLIAEQLIDYIRTHITAIGGLTPARKLAALCESFGVRSAWQGPGDVSPIGHAANLHQPARFNQAVEAFLAKLPAA